MNESNYDKSFDNAANKSASKVEKSSVINRTLASNLRRSLNQVVNLSENVGDNTQKGLKINEPSGFNERSSFNNFEENLDKSVNDKKNLFLKPIANSRLQTSNQKIQNKTGGINESVNSKLKNSSVTYDDEFDNFEASKSKILQSIKKTEKSMNKSNNHRKLDYLIKKFIYFYL